MILDTTVTWQSAFLLGRDGERIAIVGRYDVENLEAEGGFSEIIGYDHDLGVPLRQALQRLNPERIGLNYSKDNHTSDGLTHGMYLALQDWLQGTPFARRLESAEHLSAALRGRKSSLELQRLEAAIGATVTVLDQMLAHLRPGRTELDVQRWMHGWLAERSLTTAWDRRYCPTLDAGPDSPQGHTLPTATAIRPGDFFHIDFGIRQAGYCSDLQRVFYIARPGESGPPPEMQRSFDAVVAAIQAAAAVLRPGAVGWEVDDAARRSITGAGYPEYQHAVGHQVGRTVHDGATLLGPRWPRYGRSVEALVEAGEVYTLELGVMSPGGFCGLEEMVVVTADGCRFLTPPETEVILVRS